MLSMRPIALVLGLVVMVAVASGPGTRSAAAQAPGPKKNSAPLVVLPQRVASGVIAEAAASGRLDVGVIEALDASGAAEALVVLDASGTGWEKNARGPASSGRATLASMQERLALFSGVGSRVRKNYRHIPVQHLTFTSLAEVEAYLSDPGVLAIRANVARQRTVAESLGLVRQPEVVQDGVGLTGAGTSVVVIDSGIDYTHEAFGPCDAPGVPRDGAPVCRVVHSEDTGVLDDGLLDDEFRHGTQVSAIVAAVAPGASIIMHDVFEGFGAPDSAILAAIDWAIEHKEQHNIVAINMSLGGFSVYETQCSETVYSVSVRNARDAGIAVVVASGNGTSRTGISLPACVPGAVTVGAVYDGAYGPMAWGGLQDICLDQETAADQVTCFSNSAYYLSVLAPGAVISAADVESGGTSQATPHVAGAFALLRERSPDAPLMALEEAIVRCGPLVEDTRSGARGRKTHRLDIKAAVDHLDGTACPATVPNDYVSDAKLMEGPLFSDTLDTSGASNEPGDPLLPCSGAKPHGSTVWYRFTPAVSGMISLSTSGSNYDTVLAVWQGEPHSLSLLACNDDVAFDSGVTTSELRDVEVEEGTAYYVEVAGWAGGSGNLQLSATLPQPAVAGTVRGHKFNDLNRNGEWDADEPGLPGWTIYLDSNGNGQLDPEEPQAVTDGRGSYTLSAQEPGVYQVREVPQLPEWRQSAPGDSYEVTLENGTIFDERDFGNYELSTAAVAAVAPQVVESGQQFQVVIRAHQLEGMREAQVSLVYDSALLTPVGKAEPGPDFADCSQANLPLSAVVTLAMSCQQSRSGEALDLWVLTFQVATVAQDAVTGLVLRDLALVGEDGLPLPAGSTGAALTVLGAEEPLAALRVSFAFQGGARPRPGGWEQPVVIRLMDGDMPALVVEAVSSYDAETGYAYVDINEAPTGTLDIEVLGPSTLTSVARRVQVTPDMGSIHVGTLVSGDVDGNGAIDNEDLRLIIASFLKRRGHEGFDARSDLDANGLVNILDLGMAARNFGKASPMETAADSVTGGGG